MKRFLFILFMIFSHVTLLHGITYREYLSAWVGSWKGISTVYNDRNAPLRLIEVEQSFWWDGDVLRGATQFWSDTGAIQSQSQFIRYEDGSLTNEVVFSSGNKRFFKGNIEKGFLVWTWEDSGLKVRIASRIVGVASEREMQEECQELVYSDSQSQLRHIITRLNFKKSTDVPMPRKIPDINELKSKE
jgi:hypothetical protein